MNCAQVAGFDEAITAKDCEIESLKAKVAELEASLGRPHTGPVLSHAAVPVSHSSVPVASDLVELTSPPARTARTSAPTSRGKAPPVSEFSGEDSECLLEDWLPSLEQASQWNGWSEEEKMIQLAGHLKGRALQEWNLLHTDQRATFSQATEALRSRLDPVSKAVAAQDFRHATQREAETVSDFVRRLECTFRAAYGRDAMSGETRETLLYCQLQEGLRLQLMKGPAVSGARNYKELSLAAKNEEKRLADLKRRQEHSKLHTDPTSPPQRQTNKPRQSTGTIPQGGSANPPPIPQSIQKTNVKCFYCGKLGHRREECRKRKRDLAGPSESKGPSRSAKTKQVSTGSHHSSPHAAPAASSHFSEGSTSGHSLRNSRDAIVEQVDTPVQSPLSVLFSNTSRSAKTKQVSTGSHHSSPHAAPAASSHFSEGSTSGHSLGNSRDAIVEQVDTQVQSPLSVLFSDSEEEVVKQLRVADSGSCSQLARVDVYGVPADGIVDTAADITIMGGKLFALVATVAKLRKRNFRKPDNVPRNYDGTEFHLDGCMEMDLTFQGKTLATTVYVNMDAMDQLLLSKGVCRQLGIVTYHPSLASAKTPKSKEVALVPSIRVSLVQSLKLPPSNTVLVPVRLESCVLKEGETLLIEGEQLREQTGLVLENTVVDVPQDGLTHISLINMSGIMQTIPERTVVGEAQAAVVVTPESGPSDVPSTTIRKLSSSQEKERRKKLLEILQLHDVPQSDVEQLRSFLSDNHDVFSLDKREWGETALVTMDINTGDAHPRRQVPCPMPFSVRQEVMKQLQDMQRDRVIQPSNSPWSSPVVMVRRKDGSHRFCVDYCGLNAVTKADAFPHPRIDDLLDQLGGAKYFSTLDLVSGFWQIRMEPQSREKTAFTTPHGLYEFLVMPFWLTNAHAVFQRLMQRVISGLNPAEGKDFVAAYLDDILVFSSTLSDHLDHLRKVLDRL